MQEEDKEYWQQLNKAYIESSSQFDKQVLFLASGALGLSFAFIKDIVKLAVATNKWLLISSWSLFGVVILLSIISHYTSLKAINKKIHNLNAKEDKGSKKFNSYTKWFNILMIVFLALSLAFLTVFVAINI
jgi:ABC-type Fe3+-siderophore transport system permease subunit